MSDSWTREEIDKEWEDQPHVTSVFPLKEYNKMGINGAYERMKNIDPTIDNSPFPPSAYLVYEPRIVVVVRRERNEEL